MKGSRYQFDGVWVMVICEPVWAHHYDGAFTNGALLVAAEVQESHGIYKKGQILEVYVSSLEGSDK